MYNFDYDLKMNFKIESYLLLTSASKMEIDGHIFSSDFSFADTMFQLEVLGSINLMQGLLKKSLPNPTLFYQLTHQICKIDVAKV